MRGGRASVLGIYLMVSCLAAVALNSWYLLRVLIPPTVMSRWIFRERPAVLHVGAHLAEESVLYDSANWGPVIWIEAQTALAEDLKKRFQGSSDRVFQACVWSESGISMSLNISSNSQSSSVFDLGTHSHHYPEIIYSRSESHTTVRLDEVLPVGTKVDFVNLDIQGAELQALRGLGSFLAGVRVVYIEVNREELYEGIPLVSDVDDFLHGAGFLRVFTLWTHANWGDAIYVRAGRFLSAPVGQLLFAVWVWSALYLQRIKRRIGKSRLRILRKLASVKRNVWGGRQGA